MLTYAIGLIQGALLTGVALAWIDSRRTSREIKEARHDLDRIEALMIEAKDVA